MGAASSRPTWVGAALCAAAIAGPGVVCAADPPAMTLRAAAETTGRHIGVAVAYEPLVREPAYARLIQSEFNVVTPENALKWAPVQPRPELVQDQHWQVIFDAASQGRQSVRGHTLLWDQQLPAWAVALSDAELMAAQRQHIERLVKATAGRVRTWDVVNEALEDDGTISKTALWRVDGDRHLREAFVKTKALDPAAVLAYNDYGIEARNPKSDGLLRLLTAWRAAGVPVEAVGLQSHLKVGEGPRPAELAANMRRFAALGLEVHLTEIDVQVRHLAGSPWGREAAQARLLHGWTAACVAEPACRELSFWGLSDRHTWVDGTLGDDQPLLFNDDLQPKLGYYAVRAALLGQPDPTCAIERLPVPKVGAHAGWRSSGGPLQVGPKGGAAAAMVVAGRTEAWQGPVHSVLSSLTAGLPLRAGVRVRLNAGPPAPVALTLRIVDGLGERYVSVASGRANADGWLRLEGPVRVALQGELRTADLYVEGPAAGRELWIDAPSLRVDCEASP